MLGRKLAFLCFRCAGDSFRGPHDPGPGDTLTCTTCQMPVTYEELQKEALARAKKLRDARALSRKTLGR